MVVQLLEAQANISSTKTLKTEILHQLQVQNLERQQLQLYTKQQEFWIFQSHLLNFRNFSRQFNHSDWHHSVSYSFKRPRLKVFISFDCTTPKFPANKKGCHAEFFSVSPFGLRKSYDSTGQSFYKSLNLSDSAITKGCLHFRKYATKHHERYF